MENLRLDIYKNLLCGSFFHKSLAAAAAAAEFELHIPHNIYSTMCNTCCTGYFQVVRLYIRYSRYTIAYLRALRQGKCLFTFMKNLIFCVGNCDKKRSRHLVPRDRNHI